MPINIHFLIISLFMSTLPVHTEILAETRDLLNMEIEDLMNITIVKSASKYTQDTMGAPASVSVLTEQDIHRYGYRTLVDLLTSMRGLYKINDSGYEYLGIRGFSRPGDYGTRILLLIDGHKVNENFVGMASVDSAFNIDMELVQRVEIVHGPSSSLYGTGAFLAVINVFTKSGEALNGGVVSASLADHERAKVHTRYGKKLENGLEYLVSASFKDYPGQNLYLPYFDNPDYGSDGVAHQRDHEDAQHLFAKMHYKNFTFTASYMERDKGLAIPFFGPTLDSSTDVKDKRTFLDLTYHHAFTEQVEADLRLSYNTFRYDGYYHYPLEEEAGTFLNRDALQGRWWNGEGQLQWLWGKHRFISGLEYQANISQQMRNYNQLPYEEMLNSETSDNYWAFYLQDEISFTEKLTLNAGIRYDYYDVFGDTIHPRVALIYRPTEKTALKLLAGSAFRAPSAFEMYLDDGAFYKRNLEIEAETIQSYEIALEHHFNEKTQGSLSLYRYKIDNLIESNLDLADDLIFYDNTGTVTAHGIEAEFRKQWNNGVASQIGYAWQDGENADNGEKLSALPHHLLKLRASLPFKEIWQAALEIRYTGAMDTYQSPRDTLSAYTLTHFTITGELSKKLQLSASVYNLFDTEYAYPISDEFAPDRFAGEARNFRVKLDYRF